MENESQQDMTTKEVAKYLGLQMQTIHGYVRKKRLVPWNYNTWKIDGTYLFNRTEVEKFKKEIEKPGLTTTDILEYLKQKNIFVSEATLNTKIRSNEISAEMLKYRNKDIYFFKENDLESIVNVFKNHKKGIRFINKKRGYYLFQPFINKTTGEKARILKMDGPDGFALTTFEKSIAITELKNQGFEPQIKLEKVKNNKKGFILLKFPKPDRIQSKIYDVIDIIIKESGTNNIKLDSTEHEINIEVKPVLLPLIQRENVEEIELINCNIFDGEVVNRPNGIVLNSKLTSFLAYGPVKLKEVVKKFAKKENLTIEEFVIKSLEEAVVRREKLTKSQ
ncbi:helix-turn-helix domain-containing protein [Chengkuizengella sediminis]|uniref:helix-turn-helix domain-containing protein n=1 Tax=Chengkuizengella sediminis TaxID=1885917 RepID=UPI00138A43D6|nr:helix-turn-helix domain-containing protein [Chengkuizengella sediminis]NDI37230.1 helix-turn-helix domain-containing protein [Chengkuizengella sediminis]